MDDDTFQQENSQDELSEQDWAILRAFEAMDLSSLPIPAALSFREQSDTPRIPDTPGVEADNTLQIDDLSLRNSSDQSLENELLSHAEMLAIFITEVSEDLLTLRRALPQLEPLPSDDLTPPSSKPVPGELIPLRDADLQILGRTAHKIKGTAGAMFCTALATIASYLETLTLQISSKLIVPLVGLQALAQTLHALEATLNSLTATGKEDQLPLAELEAVLSALEIDITIQQSASMQSLAPSPSSATSVVRVDVRRLQELVRNSEHLITSSTSLEHAQSAVESALSELQTAHERLRRLEASFSAHFLTSISQAAQRSSDGERPASSLMARIMDETLERTGHLYARKNQLTSPPAPAHEMFPWDELEIDRFKGSALHAHSLSEAIADVATASSQLRIAYAQLTNILQKQTAQIAQVRDNTLLLQLAPSNDLISQVERAVSMSASALQLQIRFESKGEHTEIDQDILEELKQPLLQQVRLCMASSVQENGATDRVWMDIQGIANEVSIELRFSMPIDGAVSDELQAAMQRLHGSVVVQANSSGGTSFQLRLPRSHGAMRALLLRVGSHFMAVPLFQVQRVSSDLHDLSSHKANSLTPQPAPVVHALAILLGLPSQAPSMPSASSLAPVYLLLSQGEQQESSSQQPLHILEIDEIMGEAELVVQPLAAHLRRPGIIGTAIDGVDNVLLVLDLPELIRHHDLLYSMKHASTPSLHERSPRYATNAKRTILIADDSVYMRQSLRQTLLRGGYHVLEAHDGVEALEILLLHTTDILILDLEMPNLNGYEVLSLIRHEPTLASLKTVIMTARASDKHYQHAGELGAHAYLTKPSSPEILLKTLQDLLAARAVP